LIRTLRDIRFLIISFGFYLRDFAAHFDGVSPVDADIVFITVILNCIVMYPLLLLFCLFCVIYFIYLAFRTHVLSCVRGGRHAYVA
jgi:hypothetical protein